MLDDLVGVIETLQGRIEQHRPALSQSEALTRYALIDPLLRALGWDTADPALVTPEYRVGNKSADYALLKSDGVAVFLEAKRLDENLPPHRSQVVAYTSELGIRYPALTNGNEWEVYDNSQLVPIDQRRILSVSLAGAPAAVNALQLLLLWRPNLATGNPVAAAEPIVAAAAVAPEVDPQPTTQPVNNSPGEGWIPLTDVQSGGNSIIGAAKGLNPLAIRLPDGKESSTSNWWHLPREVAEYLIRTGKMTPDQYPLGQGGKSPIITTQRRPDRNGSFGRFHELSDGCFLIKINTGSNLVHNARFLLQHCGVDAGSVWLKLG